MRRVRALLGVVLGLAAGRAAAQDLPASVTRQLPRGFQVLKTAEGKLDGGLRSYVLVALALGDEDAYSRAHADAPRRPLLLFIGRTNGTYALAGRNDQVVTGLESEWQCDPFTSTYDGLTVKGPYFTVENGAACGTHWSDFVTFRYEPARHAFVFWKEIYQNWKRNDDPNGDALVLDADVVTKADPRRPVPFSAYGKATPGR